ncbi:MAG: hypothetical protein ACRDGE_03090 [Candidatus Limnocylindria bacterium]
MALAQLLQYVPAGRSRREAEAIARTLRERLGETVRVIAPYRPRDGGDRAVPLVLLGPLAVLVVEPCAAEGDLVCYQDHWYARRGTAQRRIDDAPSTRARWNAARVRSDIATGGFMHVVIDAAVVVTRGRVLDCASSCVPVLDGVEALAAHAAERCGDAREDPDKAAGLARALSSALLVGLG